MELCNNGIESIRESRRILQWHPAATASWRSIPSDLVQIGVSEAVKKIPVGQVFNLSICGATGRLPTLRFCTLPRP